MSNVVTIKCPKCQAYVVLDPMIDFNHGPGLGHLVEFACPNEACETHVGGAKVKLFYTEAAWKRVTGS